MSQPTANQPRHSLKRRVLLSIVICLLIAGIAAGLVFWIHATEPQAQKGGATRKSAAIVETVMAEQGNFRPVILSLGRVEAAREIDLSPQVNGEVVFIAENLIPGGFVEKGDVLFKIDEADYRNALAMQQSELEQRLAELEQEQGQQTAAKEEFALLGEAIEGTNRSLILREPQIRIAEARVHAARTMVDMAELNLQRTQIVAPFNAQIIARNADLGSRVAIGDTLAHLVGVEEYWVIASVPQRDLQWIDVPSTSTAGAAVEIAKPSIWGQQAVRRGVVKRLLGALDDETRLARLLITVEDPLAQEADGPPLLIGTVVETRIRGRELVDVVRIDRDYLRGNDTVWVMEEGKLAIRSITTIARDQQYAYITEGLAGGEAVITTNLATVSAGIALRLKENEASTGEPQ